MRFDGGMPPHLTRAAARGSNLAVRYPAEVRARFPTASRVGDVPRTKVRARIATPGMK